MQESLWTGAVAALLLAVTSGVAEHRRRRRTVMDRMGWVPWPLVQFLAMLAVVACISIALNLR